MAIVLAADGRFVTINHMLLPRFTLRSVLWGVTLCAVVALVAGQAVAGQDWAVATLAAVGGAVFFFLIYALAFILVQILPVDGKANRINAKVTTASKNTEPIQKESPRSLA
ncbi:MAG: hypothetical protein WD851_07970 [Pirellulales bacterium]